MNLKCILCAIMLKIDKTTIYQAKKAMLAAKNSYAGQKK
jgi:uncharacterized protein YlaI